MLAFLHCLPLLALKQKWTLEKDGKITLEVIQYEDFQRNKETGVKYGKVIKEEKFAIKNFAPVDWVIPSGSQKMVVRLTPGVWPNQESIDISNFPISGKNIVVFERSGKVWADQVDPDRPEPYLGITTHQGSVFLSFMHFKGSKVIGEVKGGRIKIKSGKANLILQSETPFVPSKIKANVYGVVKPELRTDSLNSIRTISSDTEEEFLKALAGKQ